MERPTRAGGHRGLGLTAVAGTLTMMGQTHPVTLKANRFNCYLNPMFKREVCGGDFETVIQRSQWGVNYGLPAVAPDNVFATPTYLLDGQRWSLGNPSSQQVRDLLGKLK